MSPVAEEAAGRTGVDSSPSAVPLSHGQQALWFLQQLAPESTAYHVARAVRIRSALDAPALRAALQTLVDRHASLRTTFPTVDGRPVQRLNERMEAALEEVDARSWREPELQARLAASARRRIRPAAGAAAALSALPGGRSGVRFPVRLPPHRRRPVVALDSRPGARQAVHGAPPPEHDVCSRLCPAPGVSGPRFDGRLRTVGGAAAGQSRRRAAGALLARPAGRRPAVARSPHRPSATPRADVRRRCRVPHAGRRPHPAPQGARPGPRRDPHHDPAGGLPGAAAPLHRPAGHRRRRSHRGAEPGAALRADRLPGQPRRSAQRPLRRSGVRRLPGPRPPGGAGGPAAPRLPLPAGGGAAPPRARSEPGAPVPGGVRLPEPAGGGRPGRGGGRAGPGRRHLYRRGAGAGGDGAGAPGGAVRPDPDGRRGAGAPGAVHGVQLGPVRRRHRPAHAGAPPGAAGGDRRRAPPLRLRPPPAPPGRAAPAPGGLERDRDTVPSPAPHPPALRDAGPRHAWRHRPRVRCGANSRTAT